MKKHLWAVSARSCPSRHVFDFNQGLMDFGAMICSARNPKCLVCPMAKFCRSYPFTPARERAQMTLVVTAAIVERDGRFLLTRRQKGAHLEGFWEFPGGKCETGETLADCLARELREELGVGARVGDEVLATTHAYEDRVVELHFIRCELAGEPRAAARTGDALGRARGAARTGAAAGGCGARRDAE